MSDTPTGDTFPDRTANDTFRDRYIVNHQPFACPPPRPWRPAVSTLALVCVAFVLAACGGDDETGGASVEYFAPGGVSESMVVERPTARLNLDNTAVTWLEAAGGHSGDTGIEDGVDEFTYHFDAPTQIELSLDPFDEAPQVVALDGSGTEIARVTPESRQVRLTLSGENTLRFIHPRAGDPSAAPITLFFRPVLPEPAVGGAEQANPNDVATLMASKNCPFCNLANMSWNACPQGATVASVDLSHADFTMANLACVTFRGTASMPMLMTGTIFAGASLNQVTLSGLDLTDARFSGTMFQITVFDDVTASSADFSNSRWGNSVFGSASMRNGSVAQAANFQGIQFGPSSCFSAEDLRNADFTGASFEGTSSVHGTQFGGANLFDVTFNGTKFQHDASLPNCGAPPTNCSAATCMANLGCASVGGVESCVQNQGAVTVSTPVVCQRPTVQAAARGVVIQNADLTGISFGGADLTNSVFATNLMDHTTGFAGTTLAGVDFTRENLGRSVDLSGAISPDKANYTGAILTNFPASNQGVNLSCIVNGETKTGGCDFPEQTTVFKGASMEYANLGNAGLTEANLERTVLDNANLIGAKLNFASLKGASLKGAHLGVPPGESGAASLGNAYMINVDLTDADLRSVDLTSAHVYGAVTDALFVRTLLDSADLTDAILAAAVFTDASLPGAVFNGAQLVDAKFDGATLSNAKFDTAYLQGADFSNAKTVDGMILSNAAVSTMLTTTNCKLIPPGSWMITDQDGIPYTYPFGVTQLKTDATVTCPDSMAGPCTTADSLCPIMMGPFPPVPPCVPTEQYCWENCEMPPCLKDHPDPMTHECPTTSNCM